MGGDLNTWKKNYFQWNGVWIVTSLLKERISRFIFTPKTDKKFLKQGFRNDFPLDNERWNTRGRQPLCTTIPVPSSLTNCYLKATWKGQTLRVSVSSPCFAEAAGYSRVTTQRRLVEAMSVWYPKLVRNFTLLWLLSFAQRGDSSCMQAAVYMTATL